MWRRSRPALATLGVAWLLSSPAFAAPPPAASAQPATPAPPITSLTATCDHYTVGVGPRSGWSFGDDQILLGGGAQLGHSCVRWLRFEPLLGVGLGGNFGTLRFGARARLTIFLGKHEEYGITLLAGGSGIRSFPVGRFATFCNRVGLEQCWTIGGGGEVGAAFEYWDFTLEALAGFGYLPDVVLALSYAFPVRPAVQRKR